MDPAMRVSDRLVQLRDRYLEHLPVQIGEIQGMLASGVDPAKLRMYFHTLKGGLASFGLKGLADLAEEGQEGTERLQGTSLVTFLEDLLARMNQAMADGPAPGMDPAVGLVVAHPLCPRGDGRKRIFLCEDDPVLCQTLAEQIRCFGFDVSAFETLEAARQAVNVQVPDALVMDLMHPGRPVGGAELVGELRERHAIPSVFITSQGDLPSRLAAVRAGADAYFQKPIAVSSLCATLNALTRPDEAEPCRILVIDDDCCVAERNAAILQAAGMQTRTLDDPMGTLAALEDFAPDLVLLDLHMPGCNGLDLAKAIRQMGAYLSLPIIFLSAERDPDQQFDARSTGADEFLTKPIQPEHLVSTVKVRAERMKVIRSMMVRDSLTGLYNHSTIKDFLDASLERTLRQGSEICFAMLDIDHFKSVNDIHGHSVGDQVLVALANLLRWRLRKADMIGRWGGEEFAVILSDCSLENARSYLDRIREDFATIHFPTTEGGLSVSFSAGIASSRGALTVKNLFENADRALYAAKEQGRNRVVSGA
jgi:diguanylate cyclase (GGDEF)-like protein